MKSADEKIDFEKEPLATKRNIPPYVGHVHPDNLVSFDDIAFDSTTSAHIYNKSAQPIDFGANETYASSTCRCSLPVTKIQVAAKRKRDDDNNEDALGAMLKQASLRSKRTIPDNDGDVVVHSWNGCSGSGSGISAPSVSC